MIKISDTKQPEDFNSIVEQSVAEGVIGGIVAFFQHNRVNVKPTEKCKDPLVKFVAALLSEYSDDASPYPFGDSLRAAIDERVDEEDEMLKALFSNKEIKNLNGACHVIAGTAVAEFLEANRIEVLKYVSSLRGE